MQYSISIENCNPGVSFCGAQLVYRNGLDRQIDRSFENFNPEDCDQNSLKALNSLINGSRPCWPYFLAISDEDAPERCVFPLCIGLKLGQEGLDQQISEFQAFRGFSFNLIQKPAELSESFGVFSEELSEFEIPFSEYGMPFMEWHSTT